MLNYLFTRINWPKIQAVGFDLDGTLYDEFDFINQAYLGYLRHCGEPFKKNPGPFVLKRWLEKGSSYPYIWGEAFDLYGQNPAGRDNFIKKAVEFYRSCRPQLILPPRSAFILNLCLQHWPIFLVTDGCPALQSAKFTALGLAEYFPDNRCCFTGELPPGHAKPSPQAYEALKLPYKGPEVIFFGDRDIDRDFARNLDFQFVRVAVMQPCP